MNDPVKSGVMQNSRSVLAKRNQTLNYNNCDRIKSFDLLRVLSMFYILGVWHLDDYAHNLFFSPLTQTFFFNALSMFVFISGFLITRQYKDRLMQGQIGVFYRKRILRIYPLYLLALIAFFLGSGISSKEFWSGVFLVNIFLNINVYTLWFISMIFIFYLLLPFFLTNYSIAKTILLSLSFVAISIILHYVFGLIYFRAIYYFVPFVFGMLCALHDRVFAFMKDRTTLVMSVILIVVTTYLIVPENAKWFDLGWQGLRCFVAIPLLLAISDWFSIVAQMPIIAKLSYASFCMYLYHRIIYKILLTAYQPSTDILTVLYLAVVGLPLTYLIAIVIQRSYDRLLPCFTAQVNKF